MKKEIKKIEQKNELSFEEMNKIRGGEAAEAKYNCWPVKHTLPS